MNNWLEYILVSKFVLLIKEIARSALGNCNKNNKSLIDNIKAI